MNNGYILSLSFTFCCDSHNALDAEWLPLGFVIDTL